MVLKILLMVMMVVVVMGYGPPGQCEHSSNQDILNYLRRSTKCKKPIESLVKLTVPKGYDHLEPRAVLLRKCSGLTCDITGYECVPKAGRTKTRTYHVYAYKSSDDFYPDCVQVEEEEHTECECACLKTQSDCPRNTLLRDYSCECECDQQTHMTACMDRRLKQQSVMWSPNQCACICNARSKECGRGEIWSDGECRCKRYIWNEN